MPETITIAGRKLPKTIVYIAGAATVGIVGYAYIIKSTNGEEETTEFLDTAGDERITPTTLDTFDVKVDTRAGYKTDSEWYSAAIDALTSNYGVASVSVAASALDKFLAGRELTTAEISMITYVVNLIGHPPSGQKAIRPTTTSTPPTPAQTSRALPGAITGLTLWGNRTDINSKWNRATNAVKYQVHLIAGYNTVLKSVVVTNPTWRVGGGLQPGHPYRISVWGVNSAGQLGPQASKVFTTKR